MGIIEMDRGGSNAGDYRSSPSRLRNGSGEVDKSILGSDWRTGSRPFRLSARSGEMDRGVVGNGWRPASGPSRLFARSSRMDSIVMRSI